MCDPVTATLAAISTVGGIVGSVSQGLNQRAASDYNAKVADDAADQATAQAALDETQSRDKARRLLASQKTGYAASGVDVGSGSPQEVAQDDTAQAEMDALTIRYGGALKARSYRAEAAADKTQGANALSGGIFNAFSTVATQGADLYLKYHPPTVPASSNAALTADPYPGVTGR